MTQERSSIGAVGSFVRLPGPRMLLEFEVFGFSQVSGQPLTAAWLCFEAEVWVSSPHCRPMPMLAAALVYNLIGNLLLLSGSKFIK